MNNIEDISLTLNEIAENVVEINKAIDVKTKEVTGLRYSYVESFTMLTLARYFITKSIYIMKEIKDWVETLSYLAIDESELNISIHNINSIVKKLLYKPDSDTLSEDVRDIKTHSEKIYLIIDEMLENLGYSNIEQIEVLNQNKPHEFLKYKVEDGVVSMPGGYATTFKMKNSTIENSIDMFYDKFEYQPWATSEGDYRNPVEEPEKSPVHNDVMKVLGHFTGSSDFKFSHNSTAANPLSSNGENGVNTFIYGTIDEVQIERKYELGDVFWYETDGVPELYVCLTEIDYTTMRPQLKENLDKYGEPTLPYFYPIMELFFTNIDGYVNFDRDSFIHTSAQPLELSRYKTDVEMIIDDSTNSVVQNAPFVDSDGLTLSIDVELRGRSHSLKSVVGGILTGQIFKEGLGNTTKSKISGHFHRNVVSYIMEGQETTSTETYYVCNSLKIFDESNNEVENTYMAVLKPICYDDTNNLSLIYHNRSFYVLAIYEAGVSAWKDVSFLTAKFTSIVRLVGVGNIYEGDKNLEALNHLSGLRYFSENIEMGNFLGFIQDIQNQNNSYSRILKPAANSIKSNADNLFKSISRHKSSFDFYKGDVENSTTIVTEKIYNNITSKYNSFKTTLEEKISKGILYELHNEDLRPDEKTFITDEYINDFVLLLDSVDTHLVVIVDYILTLENYLGSREQHILPSIISESDRKIDDYLVKLSKRTTEPHEESDVPDIYMLPATILKYDDFGHELSRTETLKSYRPFLNDSVVNVGWLYLTKGFFNNLMLEDFKYFTKVDKERIVDLYKFVDLIVDKIILDGVKTKKINKKQITLKYVELNRAAKKLISMITSESISINDIVFNSLKFDPEISRIFPHFNLVNSFDISEIFDIMRPIEPKNILNNTNSTTLFKLKINGLPSDILNGLKIVTVVHDYTIKKILSDKERINHNIKILLDYYDDVKNEYGVYNALMAFILEKCFADISEICSEISEISEPILNEKTLNHIKPILNEGKSLDTFKLKLAHLKYLNDFDTISYDDVLRDRVENDGFLTEKFESLKAFLNRNEINVGVDIGSMYGKFVATNKKADIFNNILDAIKDTGKTIFDVGKKLFNKGYSIFSNSDIFKKISDIASKAGKWVTNFLNELLYSKGDIDFQDIIEFFYNIEMLYNKIDRHNKPFKLGIADDFNMGMIDLFEKQQNTQLIDIESLTEENIEEVLKELLIEKKYYDFDYKNPHIIVFGTNTTLNKIYSEYYLKSTFSSKEVILDKDGVNFPIYSEYLENDDNFYLLSPDLDLFDKTKFKTISQATDRYFELLNDWLLIEYGDDMNYEKRLKSLKEGSNDEYLNYLIDNVFTDKMFMGDNIPYLFINKKTRDNEYFKLMCRRIYLHETTSNDKFLSLDIELFEEMYNEFRWKLAENLFGVMYLNKEIIDDLEYYYEDYLIFKTISEQNDIIQNDDIVITPTDLYWLIFYRYVLAVPYIGQNYQTEEYVISEMYNDDKLKNISDFITKRSQDIMELKKIIKSFLDYITSSDSRFNKNYTFRR